MVGTLLALALAGASDVRAERLAIRQYGQRDGLAQNHVTAVYQDGKGYLWFGTREGLSRFDGERFTTYSVRDGLGHPVVNAIAEDARGRLWVGTNGAGVARLAAPGDMAPASPGTEAQERPRKFVTFQVGTTTRENRVNEIAFDRTGILWCLTDHGLFRSTAPPGDTVEFVLAWRFQEAASRMAALADPDGSVWMSYFDGLLHIRDGRFVYYAPPVHLAASDVSGLARDRAGRLLYGGYDAVYAFSPPRRPGDPPQWSRLPLALGRGEFIARLIGDRDGTLWLGTNHRLLRMDAGGRFRALTTADGLPDAHIISLFEDRQGDLWLGTANAGLCRLTRSPIVSLTVADGLPITSVSRIVVSHDGRIYAITNGGVAEIVDNRAVLVRGSDAPRFADRREWILQDHRGDWWMASRDDAYRFTGPALQYTRGRRIGRASGLPGPMFQLPYQDPRGRLWINARDAGVPALYRAEAAPGDRVRFQRTEAAEGQPILGDRAGTMWIGSRTEPRGRQGTIQRWRGEERLTLEPSAGLPETFARSFFLDSRGWLWIGLAHRGVSMTRDPNAAQPAFINISTRDGLSSDVIWSIAEDDAGRMYFGTRRGLDQFEPASGRVRHLTVADGLVGEEVVHCVKDQRGDIWAATTRGVSRVDPRAIVPATRAPDVYLTRVMVAGEELPIDETGVREVTGLRWLARQNNLLFEFVAPHFGRAGALAYEYRLDGLERAWTRATDRRSVTYAYLAPGAYRFEVRARDREEGLVSPPAVLAFEILPPVWRRSWFLLLAATAVGAAMYGLYRLRLGQVLAMERIRTQIATDLHDDVGSSLAQIAILSEVVRRETSPKGAALLERAASLARGLRESMSDIVWAIDPDKDHVLDLVTRMKHVAFNALEADGVAVTFQGPGDDARPARLALAPDRRRHLLLMFKEMLTNVARHARATQVDIEVAVDPMSPRVLRLQVRDNGRGFDHGSQDASHGHGLRNLTMRASALRGTVAVHTRPGDGTRIDLVVPLR